MHRSAYLNELARFHLSPRSQSVCEFNHHTTVNNHPPKYHSVPSRPPSGSNPGSYHTHDAINMENIHVCSSQIINPVCIAFVPNHPQHAILGTRTPHIDWDVGMYWRCVCTPTTWPNPVTDPIPVPSRCTHISAYPLVCLSNHAIFSGDETID